MLEERVNLRMQQKKDKKADDIRQNMREKTSEQQSYTERTEGKVGD